ncbi:hypothetical protein AGLY_008263 [Aphis glycines]|uniref:Uncharacterized protein n=1 Tax=Aphis glycines TaxID=307491 RepID=A0A6G0TLS9_APHGL|nr:hypothetical protein AGLY_008263 [Aphis glycines]
MKFLTLYTPSQIKVDTQKSIYFVCLLFVSDLKLNYSLLSGYSGGGVKQHLCLEVHLIENFKLIVSYYRLIRVKQIFFKLLLNSALLNIIWSKSNAKKILFKDITIFRICDMWHNYFFKPFYIVSLKVFEVHNSNCDTFIIHQNHYSSNTNSLVQEKSKLIYIYNICIDKITPYVFLMYINHMSLIGKLLFKPFITHNTMKLSYAVINRTVTYTDTHRHTYINKINILRALYVNEFICGIKKIGLLALTNYFQKSLSNYNAYNILIINYKYTIQNGNR